MIVYFFDEWYIQLLDYPNVLMKLFIYLLLNLFVINIFWSL